MITREKGKFQIREFLLFAAVFAGIRQALLSSLPIYAIPAAAMDDALMVRGAWSMIRNGAGGWLGPYDHLTLVKGAFFPVFLAAAYKLGISYISAASLAYSLACVVFIIAVSRLFRTKYPLYVSYLFLLFNPAAFSGEVLQRVYRNSITPAQVLLIFGCFFGLYLRRRERLGKLLFWALGAGAAWASLEHSREDAVWVLPAALMMTGISAAAVIKDAASSQSGGRIKPGWRINARLGIFLLPVFIFWVSHPAIAAVNQIKYGVFCYNELNDSHFADAMKAIYGTKMEGEDIPYVSVSRAKLKRLYEISPSLKKIEPFMEEQMDIWSRIDCQAGDGEVEDGWFFWAFREAVFRAGYYETAKTADGFYREVSTEVQGAFDDGRLERQRVMPSPLMPPWRKGRFGRVMSAFGQTIPFMFTYQMVTPDDRASASGPGGGIALFETVTGNRAVYPKEERLTHPDWEDFNAETMRQRCARLAAISRFYGATGTAAAIFGIICWFCLTVQTVRCARSAHDPGSQDQRLSFWLVLSALLGGFLCLAGGVSYNDAASCPSIGVLYLCGGYPLILAFWTLAAGWACECALGWIANEKIHNSPDGSARLPR